MILSDKTIAESIEDEEIAIEPVPDPEQVQPASLDLRIGETLYDPRTDESLDTLVVKPKTRYHAYTVEEISFPNDIGGWLTGRSTYGRKGLEVHQTAGWFDPGFSGHAKMELYNYSSRRIHLEPGARVCQMVFARTDRPTDGYSGQYQNQKPGEVPTEGRE